LFNFADDKQFFPNCGAKAMKEIQFIHHNLEKWKRMEEDVENSDSLSPDILADTYTELTSDLAFAQTNFPSSRITIYLNNLASALHNKIYRNKRDKWSRILSFWKQEVPEAMYESRRMLLVSFVIFIIAAAIGFLSGMKDPEYARHIMGDDYIDMTLENIHNGNPMGVYASDSQASSFLEITFNNVFVSFQTFVMGLVTFFGTMYALIENGIMIGAFQSFLYGNHVLGESMLAVFLHGTLELSAIIVAGAAGLTLGTGWLMPGSYSRIEAFRRSAFRGVKIIIGTVPIFILAGFIEGFITRFTRQPDILRLTWILISAAFVIFYYVLLPLKLYKNGKSKIDKIVQTS
jgi:uncharacterized membrane protein SpoIIM required for sporulation